MFKVAVKELSERKKATGPLNYRVDLRSNKLLWLGDGKPAKVRFFVTKTEAEAFAKKVNDEQAKTDPSLQPADGNHTIAEAIQLEVDEITEREAAGDICWKTWECDCYNVNSWVAELGNVECGNLLKIDVQDLVNSWDRSRTTKLKRINALRRAFEKAREQKWVNPHHPNPTDGIKLYQKKHGLGEEAARESIEKNIKKFDPDQIKHLVEKALEVDRDYNDRQLARRQKEHGKIGHNQPPEAVSQLKCEGLALYFAFKTGLRFGEQFALKWQDIDFERSFINVRVALRLIANGQIEVGKPKSKLAVRHVTLPPSLATKLLAWKALTLWSGNDDLVFPTMAGTYHISAHNLRRRTLNKACNAIGAKRFRWHDARHFHASVLLNEYGDNWMKIADQMGHHSADFTRRQYGHWLDDKVKDQNAEGAALDNAVGF